MEIDKVESLVNEGENPETIKVLQNAKEILSDPKFIEQKGVRSIVDQEAKVGHKSKTSHFFGYKTEFLQIYLRKSIKKEQVMNEKMVK